MTENDTELILIFERELTLSDKLIGEVENPKLTFFKYANCKKFASSPDALKYIKSSKCKKGEVIIVYD